MRLRKINNQYGFTLMEMIVSVAIIGSLSALFFANYHGYKTSGELNMAAQKLASDIRLAQTYALSMKEFNGIAPTGGWGVYFKSNGSDNKAYIIFVDSNHNSVYDGNTELFRQVNLPAGIVISQIVLGATQRHWTGIIFIPPDPAITICHNWDQCETTGKISLSGQSGTKEIEVNSYGLVDVIN